MHSWNLGSLKQGVLQGIDRGFMQPFHGASNLFIRMVKPLDYWQMFGGCELVWGDWRSSSVSSISLTHTILLSLLLYLYKIPVKLRHPNSYLKSKRRYKLVKTVPTHTTTILCLKRQINKQISISAH